MASINPLRPVLLDRDGTLVDSLPDIAGALNHALAGAGAAGLERAEVASLVGDGVIALAKRALALRSVPAAITAEALADTIVARHRAFPCIDTRPFAGVADVLDELERAGLSLAVVTNKAGDVARSLIAALGWRQRFVAVCGDGDGHPPKPAAAVARGLLGRFDVTPAETLMASHFIVAYARNHAAGRH